MTIGYLFLLLLFFGYGGYLRYHAPKEIGHKFGYRSAQAMKSQRNWDMAQKIVSRYLYRLAILTLFLLILTRFSPVEVPLSIQRVLMVIPVVLLIYSTNRVADQLPD